MVLEQVKFIGMDLSPGGTQPTHSKNDEFAKIEQRNTGGS